MHLIKQIQLTKKNLIKFAINNGYKPQNELIRELIAQKYIDLFLQKIYFKN